MTATMPHKNLESIYKFFETYGSQRLQGLDESYFIALNESEKEHAWNFLKEGFSLSAERIDALYLLDKLKAVGLFKETLSLPAGHSEFAAEREAFERNRLLMLKYVNSVEPSARNIEIMSDFANSEFPQIRAEFAQYLPVHQATDKALEALRGMIFTETERVSLTSAIVKFMAIYHMDYDPEDPLYKSIYLSLRSDNEKEKFSGIKRLQRANPIGDA